MPHTRAARRDLLIAGAASLLTVGSADIPPAARRDAATRSDALPTRRTTDADGKSAALGAGLAQHEVVAVLTDFVLDDDDTVVHPSTGRPVRDHTQAMTRALATAMTSGAAATICLPAGNYVMAPFVVDRPVRIVGIGSDPARFGTALQSGARAWGGTTVLRRGDDPAALVTVRANGVTIEGLTFDGGGTSAPIVHVAGASEFRLARSRMVNAVATGLLIDHTFNALFDTVFVNNCGAAGSAASVVVNSAPPDKDGALDPSRTNCVDFRCLTIEQNRDTALAIGVDPAKNRADRDQYPEYLRFLDLHVESSNYTGADDGFLPSVPAVRVGVVNSATFTAPMIYGGPGPVVQQDAGEDAAVRSSGITFLGGVLRGQIRSVRPTPTLIDLVKGDEFRVIGTRFTQYTGSPVHVRRGYGPAVHIDPSTALGSAPGTANEQPVVLDERDDGVATTRRQVLGTTELHGPLVSRARPVVARPASDVVASVELLPGSDELRGRLVFTTSPIPRAGPQVSVVLPDGVALSGAAAVSVTPSDAATARLRPYAQLRSDRTPNELWLALSDTPDPVTRYGFYYAVLG